METLNAPMTFNRQELSLIANWYESLMGSIETNISSEDIALYRNIRKTLEATNL